MKRLFAISVVMLLYSAMFFVVVCTGADPVTKPLKAMWTGTLYISPNCADPGFQVPFPFSPPVFQVINVGKGVSTGSGESDWLSVICTYFTSADLSTMAGSGWGLVTAANGDTIHAQVELTVDRSTDPPRWTETETFVGGTGRFEGATGRSDSGGTWTVTDPFPSVPGIPPQLLKAPQGWVGTSIGEITF